MTLHVSNNIHSLFRHNLESHFSEIWIFLQHYHGNRKTGFVLKMELHSSWWVSQEISLVLHMTSRYQLRHDIMEPIYQQTEK